MSFFRIAALVLGIGTTSTAFAFVLPDEWNIRQIDLRTNQLLYDARSGSLVVSVPSIAGVGLGNTVTLIDPVTASITSSVFVGSEPGPMGLSSDGSALYVGLNGSASVRRFDMLSRTAGQQFGLGSDSSFGPYYAEDIAVMPNNPDVVAVSRRNDCCSPRHEGVALFVNGTMLPTTTPDHTGSNRIEFGPDPLTLLGYNNETTEFGLRAMAITESGVTVTAVAGVFSGFNIDIEYSEGALFATSGRVADARSGQILGTYGSVGPVEPDVASEMVFFLESNSRRLVAYDLTTFVPLRTYDLPGVVGTPDSLERWGANGLAFRTTSGQVFVLSAVPEPEQWLLLAVGLLLVLRNVRRAKFNRLQDVSPPVHRSHNTCLGFGKKEHVLKALRVAIAATFLFSSGTVKASFDANVTWRVRSISLPSNDLIFDGVNNRLFASVPSRAGAVFGNSITAIDPLAGVVTDSTFIGSEPGQLALSDDSSTLYAALGGAASVRRFDVATRTPGIQFSLGSDSFSGPFVPVDLEVVPGGSSSVAVARGLGCCGHVSSDGVLIYDDGVARPVGPAYSSSIGKIEFGSSAAQLYGYNNRSTGFDFYVMNVDDDGASINRSIGGLITGFGTDIVFSGSLIYATSGRVIDPQNLSIVGTYTGSQFGWNSVVPDLAEGVVYLLGRDSNGVASIDAFDLDTFVPVGSIKVPEAAGTPGALLRIGGNGFAFHTTNDQIFLLSPVPEPHEGILLLSGLLLIIRRRCK